MAVDMKKIISLLESNDWEHINQGFELFRSLGDPAAGPALLSAVWSEEMDWNHEIPPSFRIDVRAWEDDFESCTFKAGEETWEGGVQHGGKTTVPIQFDIKDVDSLTWVVTCLKEDHWDSTLPLTFDYPDSTNGKCSDAFYMNKEGIIVDGEPEPSGDDWVEREYRDGMGSVYSGSYGFSPQHFWCSVDDMEVGDHISRTLLLSAALVAGVDLSKLPTIDHSGRQNEIDSLKSDCCDRF